MIPSTAVWRYSPEAIGHSKKIPPGVIEAVSHELGMKRAEPLLIAMDALLTYAKAFRKRFEMPLADDNQLGPYWLDSIQNLRRLLNGDGAVAWQLDRSTDSKSNGVLEGMFWDALSIAGYTEADLNT